jgi:hypothetical protein
MSNSYRHPGRAGGPPYGLVAVGLTTTSVAAVPNGTTSTTALIQQFVTGAGGFIGTVTLTGFQLVNGMVAAVGTLSGNVLNGTGPSSAK